MPKYKHPKQPYGTYVKAIKRLGGKEFFTKSQFYSRPKLVRGWHEERRRKYITSRTSQTERGLRQAGISRRKQRQLRD